MSFTRLFAAVLGSLDEPLTDAHLREDLKVLDWSMSIDQSPENSGGQPWVVKIEVPNPGLAILSPGQPRYVAFIEAVPGSSIADATVLARAVIKPLSGDLGGRTAWLDCVCAPVDIQGRLLAFSLTLATGLEYDELFEDVSFQRPQDVLQARSASFYVDPVSHGISLHDWIDGDGTAVVDLDILYDHASIKVDALKPPVPRVRLQITAGHEQRAWGICDVASSIDAAAEIDGGQPYIQTLNSDFVQRADRQLPGGLVRLGLGSGWTHEAGQDSVDVYGATSRYVASGRTLDIGYTTTSNTVGQLLYYAPDGTPFYQVSQSNAYSSTQHDEYIRFQVYQVHARNVPIRYDYSQQRTEVATLLVSIGLDSADLAGVAAEEELPAITLGDLTQAYVPNPHPIPEPDEWGNYLIPYVPFVPVQPWSYETDYKAGDVVEFQGGWYKAKADVQGDFYKSDRPPGTTISYDASGNLTYAVNTGYDPLHPYWEAFVPKVALPDRRAPTFFDTPRGLAAIQHGILRARAYLRKRLLNLQVSFTARWEEARDLTPGSRVRIRVLSGAVLQPMVGHVTKLDRKWKPEGRTVEITMLVAAGTGAGTPPTPVSAVSYVEDGYLVDGYVEQPAAGTTEFAFGDVQWAWTAPAAYVPVDAYSLPSPGYSVLQCTVTNQANDQLNVAQRIGWQGGNPAQCSVDRPTQMSVRMRPIASTGPIQRLYDVAAIVDVSPRGVNLSVPGAEP